MRRYTSSVVLAALIAALTACAAPPGAVREPVESQDLAPVRQQQQEISRTLERLQEDVLLLQARLRAQQQTIDELRGGMAPQKGTRPGEKAAAKPAAPASIKPDSAATPAGLYRNAFGEYASARYPQAIAGFENFLRLHPRHEQAGNALYWLGECYYAGEQQVKAAETFGKVAESYPSAGRAPDALLRLAETVKQMGDERRGDEVLSLLREKYPESAAARKSREHE